MKLSILRLLLLSFLVLTSLGTSAEDFRVSDIRIEGLQRVSAKNVFSRFPIKVNQQVSTDELQDAVREVFKTGFFSDIEIARDGNILILSVVERPAVNRIGIVGNSVIETEPLLDGLKASGLVEGDIFKQAALDTIERELNAQYSAIGRYATQIQTKVIDLPKNQVNIAIKIVEGNVASIKHVNIVGNKAYPEEELQALFEVKEEGRWSWITGSDKYAQQKLAGDLERLKTFYFDKGYLEFETTSTQVSLSPSKDEVYITVNIFEGKPYTISDIELAGKPVLSEEKINTLMTLKEGQIFSQTALLETSQAIEKSLGDLGYSYAQARGAPELNKDEKTAKIVMFVDPGTINYVRRIVFKGNTTTQDNVLRREMRQLEGAPVSTEKLSQSRARLSRLSLFSDVRMAMENVPGRPDQVDVIFTVTEQPSGSINASLGFSQGSGITFGAGLSQNNWLGTGNTLGFNVSRSEVETSYSFNYTNPYFTQDGVSRGINVFYTERDLGELDIANFSTDRVGAKMTFGYPVSEISRVSFGVGVENISIVAGSEAPQEIAGSPRLRSGVTNRTISNTDYTNTLSPLLSDTNGNGFFDEDDTISSAAQTAANGLTSTALADSQLLTTPQGFLDVNGNDFTTVNVDLGWSASTLNRGIFATDGYSQRVNFEVSAPGSDLEFYKLTYRGEIYKSLTKNVTARLKSRLGYADAYGDINELPFFENFFSGGSSSVRGFESSSLGPKGTPAVSYIAVPSPEGFAYVLDGTQLSTFTDVDRQTLGGNMLFETGVELIFPVPFTRNAKSVRSLFFIDAGNVFSDSCTSTQVNCSNFDLSKLSAATGFGIQWLSPVGPLSLYFSKALQEQPFDKTESFQFSLGQSF